MLNTTLISGRDVTSGVENEYFKRKKKMSWTDKKFNFSFMSTTRTRSRTQQEYAKRNIEDHKVIAANLRKLKKLQKRWFVLYSGDLDGSHPAHLEYHENEKNWREHKPPRNEYILEECLNICQREGRDQKFKYVIDVVSLQEFLSIVFEEEQELKLWLDHLLSLQKGRSVDGKIPKPNYDHVFPVQVKSFKPEESANTYLISGPHRLCVTSEDLRFFPQGCLKPVIFRLESVRSHICIDKMFHFQTGRSSPSGAGTLILQCDDRENAGTLNNAVNHAMRNAKDAAKTRQSHQTRRRDHPHDVSTNSLNTSSITDDIRRRSESMSKIDKSRLGTSMPKPAIQPVNHIDPSMQSRTRTISEGNHMESHRGGRSWGPSYMRTGGGKSGSLFSGSPLSPNQGSYVSSESAGSSNSIDDADFFHTRQNTIFEESSAESFVDPAALRSMSTVSHQRTNSDQVMYTPVHIQGFPYATTSRETPSASSSYASPALSSHVTPSSGTQYASIVNTKATANAPQSSVGGDSDYMDMTPASTEASSATSSLKRHTGTSSLLIEAGQKRLISLGALDDPSSAMSSVATVTSPSSQSSYNTQDDNDDSAYHVMSPLGRPNSDTLPREMFNSTSRKPSVVSTTSLRPAPAQQPQPADDDYMAMSPVTSVSMSTSNSLSNSMGHNSVGSSSIPGQWSRKNMDIPLNHNHNNNTNNNAPGASLGKSPPNSEADDNRQDYEIMSPVSVFRPISEAPSGHAQPLSAIEEQLGGPIPGTPTHLRSEMVGGARRKTSHVRSVDRTGSKRNSFCSDVDGRWSPIDMPLIDPDGIDDVDTPDYVPIDYSQGGMGIPIPMGTRMSPASSSSLISGTPNSSDLRFLPDYNQDQGPGVSHPITQSIKSVSLIRHDDDDDEVEERSHIRAYSISSGKGSSELPSSGGRSRTTSMSRFMELPGRGSWSKLAPSSFGRTPPTSMGVPAGQSPKFISFFRRRTGSVPSKANCNNRRRHRTQSEGEKDSDDEAAK